MAASTWLWYAPVYPRACGGTPLEQVSMSRVSGLSPRVRGKPADFISAGPLTRVYPRACGGTSFRSSTNSRGPGLSPRVRGNQLISKNDGQWDGSIPARAGEPESRECDEAVDSVYPRACGGTLGGGLGVKRVVGLSPRVRGNHSGLVTTAHNPRSIPARAGEPHGVAFANAGSAVYPRACGGTVVRADVGVAGSGLSPRRAGEPVLGALSNIS